MRRLVRRLLTMVPVLFAIVTFTFLLTHLAGSDPAVQIAGPQATQATIQHIRVELGLNKPIFDQYTTYLGNVVRLNFGTSIFTGEAVFHALITRIPATLEIVFLGMCVAVLLGVGFGVLAARGRGHIRDRAVRGASFGVLALPDFWIALLMIYVFYYLLNWAPPPLGQFSLTDAQPTTITHAAILDSILTLNGPALGAAIGHAILPVLTVGLLFSAPIARLTRSSVIEVLGSDYVRYAEACGLPQKTLWRYTVRASLAPVVTFVGILFTVLLGGLVLVEQVFSWGGAAQYVAQAAQRDDYPIIQGFVLLSGVFAVIVFLIVDVVLQLIDPRVRLET